MRGERSFVLYMLVPAFFFLIMFYIYPTLFNAVNSFTDLSLFGLKRGGDFATPGHDRLIGLRHSHRSCLPAGVSCYGSDSTMVASRGSVNGGAGRCGGAKRSQQSRASRSHGARLQDSGGRPGAPPLDQPWRALKRGFLLLIT